MQPEFKDMPKAVGSGLTIAPDPQKLPKEVSYLSSNSTKGTSSSADNHILLLQIALSGSPSARRGARGGVRTAVRG